MSESSAWLGSKRDQSVEFGGDVLEEPGEDREAADDDASSNFGPGPEAHTGDVIADIRRANKFPSVIDACDRRYASTRCVS